MMAGVLHPDVEPMATEVFFHGEGVPLFGNGGGQAQAVQIRPQAQNAFHTAHHHGGSRTGEPVNLGPAKVPAGGPFGELPVAVGFQMADLGPVVLGGRGILGEVSESPLPVTAQGLGQNQPALGLGEDAGVFLGAGVVDDSQRAVKGVGMVGRVHQNGAVCSVQPLADPFHDGVGLVRICQPADDGPALGVQPEVGLRCGGFADPLAGLGEATNKPVAVPAQLLDAALILGQLFIQPADILVGAAVGGKLPQNPHGVVELEGHKGRLAVGAQPQAVVPVGRRAGRGGPDGSEKTPPPA